MATAGRWYRVLEWQSDRNSIIMIHHPETEDILVVSSHEASMNAVGEDDENQVVGAEGDGDGWETPIHDEPA